MQTRYILYSVCLAAMCASFSPLEARGSNAPATQQQHTRTIKGTVVDETGMPVIGASVKAEGTTTGVITDIDGHFTLQVPANAKLVISYIGYISQTVAPQDGMKVTLREDMMKLDEVVVVGYGTQKMKNVTGAIEVIKPDEIKDLSVGNLSAALGGLINGLSSSGGFGRPGEAATLQIRQAKVASAYAGKGGETSASPLYVIDDFVTDEEAFNNLDADEVESITVLKDASAAVYGARAAQGVVLVKTKRGQVGAPKISYSGQFGVTDAVYRTKMLSAYDQGAIWNAIRAARTSTDEESSEVQKDLFQADELAAMRGLNYDLLDQEWKAAFTQRHSLNINGGTEKATYFAGISYFDQDGNIGRLNYDRWNFRAGVNANISKWFKASLQLSGDYGETNKAKNGLSGGGTDLDFNTLLTHPRWVPDYVGGMPLVQSGMQNEPPTDLNLYNFSAVQNSPDNIENQSSNMTINSSVEYDFGWSNLLKGLKLKATYSRSISNDKGNETGTSVTVYQMLNRTGSGAHLYTGADADYSENNLRPIEVNNGNNLSRSNIKSDNYQVNLTASYAREFGLHNVSALFSIEKSEAETEDVLARVSDPYKFTDGSSKSAYGSPYANFGRSESGMLSYVGRLNYSYADRYLFEFLIRSDASTKFAPKNYWGTFPSFSAGWVVSEEGWFKDHVKFMDFLKVRLSFGILGKDNIQPWRWTQLYNVDQGKGAVFGNNSQMSDKGPGSKTGDAPNPDAHWDKSYKTNLGFDMRFLNSRLSVNLDAYLDKNRDMFMNRTGASNFPSTVGTQPTAENFGAIDAWGVELSLGWRDNIGKDFKYHVKVNTGYSDNRIKKMAWPDRIELDGARPNERSDRGTWGYECIGMFRSYQEIQEYFTTYGITNYLGNTIKDVHPGMLIYRDIRGAQNQDGTWQPADGIINDNDRIEISHRASNTYGFTVNLGAEWKSLSLSAQFNANWGGYDLVDKSAYYLKKGYKDVLYTNMPSFWSDMFVYEDIKDAQGNVTVPANRDARFPNLRYMDVNSQASTFWKVSATSISLRNITLAYTLPKDWTSLVGIESCRLNFTCQNAISFTSPYPDHFMNPWAGAYGKYPNLRKYTLGVNISF